MRKGPPCNLKSNLEFVSTLFSTCRLSKRTVGILRHGKDRHEADGACSGATNKIIITACRLGRNLSVHSVGEVDEIHGQRKGRRLRGPSPTGEPLSTSLLPPHHSPYETHLGNQGAFRSDLRSSRQNLKEDGWYQAASRETQHDKQFTVRLSTPWTRTLTTRTRLTYFISLTTTRITLWTWMAPTRRTARSTRR